MDQPPEVLTAMREWQAVTDDLVAHRPRVRSGATRRAERMRRLDESAIAGAHGHRLRRADLRAAGCGRRLGAHRPIDADEANAGNVARLDGAPVEAIVAEMVQVRGRVLELLSTARDRTPGATSTTLGGGRPLRGGSGRAERARSRARGGAARLGATAWPFGVTRSCCGIRSRPRLRLHGDRATMPVTTTQWKDAPWTSSTSTCPWPSRCACNRAPARSTSSPSRARTWSSRATSSRPANPDGGGDAGGPVRARRLEVARGALPGGHRHRHRHAVRLGEHAGRVRLRLRDDDERRHRRRARGRSGPSHRRRQRPPRILQRPLPDELDEREHHRRLGRRRIRRHDVGIDHDRARRRALQGAQRQRQRSRPPATAKARSR